VRLVFALAVVAMSAAFAGPAASSASAPVPVLGNAFAGSKGFGHAHPRLLSTGASPTVTVDHLHWRHWGAKRATGTGKGWYVPDDAKAVADGKVATAKVVAFRLGKCHGKRAYLKYIWYFPAYRKAPPRREANPACL
jgi:hypothetical protein